mmetsp:Transcript_9157/g.17134  ORF Transcript_9157/g.17134 Transcript_9157/m.17134 type:complete len:282 (+) Transcript_9157:88-933(+)
MAQTCASDDRETPLKALQDLTAAVSHLFEDKDVSRIRVYDPYFCKGTIIKSLVQCGFIPSLIFNEDKDCYEEQKRRQVPANDIIITNPPYSGNHIQRALHYAESTRQVWAMLLPSYVLFRPWFSGEVRADKLVFLCPHERYAFKAVENERTIADDNHVPFVTMWFIGGLSSEQKQRLSTEHAAARTSSGVTLAMNEIELPRRVRKLLPFTKNKASSSKKVRNRRGDDKNEAGKKRRKQRMRTSGEDNGWVSGESDKGGARSTGGDTKKYATLQSDKKRKLK